MVPSRVSRQWLSPRDASFPPSGPGRARFPALSGTMKALRLPTRVSMVTYWFASTAHAILLRSCLAAALPEVRRSLPGQGLGCCRPPFVPACSHVDANGISQVFRRSVLCLCSVPGPRSNRRALATHGHVDAAPAIRTAKASAMADFGANPKASAPAAIRFTRDVAAHVQGLLPAGRLGLFPGGGRTLWTATKGFSSFDDHPPFLLS
jgi:hypothetical protein